MKMVRLRLERVQEQAPSCTSQRHGRTFSSPWGCVRALRLPHALHIGRQFSRFLGISNTLLRIWYSASSSLDLVGFSDADFAGCVIDRKSTSGTCLFLGSSLICWPSRKQSSVAHSTTEAGYVAVASCCSQIL
jgi:hypothetical protein